MANHTPGPWSVEDEREDRIAVRSEDGALIADCCDGHYNDSGDFIRAAESLPNARLLAAAPDLLEALRQIEMIDTQNFAPGEVTSPTERAQWEILGACAKIARAARACATGDQP
jgi:hypothetical protein